VLHKSRHSGGPLCYTRVHFCGARYRHSGGPLCHVREVGGPGTACLLCKLPFEKFLLTRSEVVVQYGHFVGKLGQS